MVLVNETNLEDWDNIVFHARNVQYTSSAASDRTNLINNYGWSIIDGGQS